MNFRENTQYSPRKEQNIIYTFNSMTILYQGAWNILLLMMERGSTFPMFSNVNITFIFVCLQVHSIYLLMREHNLGVKGETFKTLITLCAKMKDVITFLFWKNFCFAPFIYAIMDSLIRLYFGHHLEMRSDS